jgi:cystathionine beta-lyase/cystathionine gamma-synthase
MPNLSEILFQLGEDGELSSSPVTPPIYQTSNFYFPKVSDLRKAFTNEFRTHIYTRGNNPTVEILRKKLAALAGAEDALVVSSGAAAMSIAVLAQVKTGDHIVCVKNLIAGQRN